MKFPPKVASCSVIALVTACSGTTVTNTYVNPTAGTSSTGGASSTIKTATGGRVTAGGASNDAGTNQGGSPGASGGATASVTNTAIGGTTTGGTSAVVAASTVSGGTSIGGNTATGGTAATGGSTAIGGSTATGGVSIGGSVATGGTTAAPGGAPTGGTTAVTGGSATGGTTAASGGAPTGGTTTVTGGSATGGTTAVTGGSATGGTTAVTGGNATGGATAATGGSATGGSATGGATEGGQPSLLSSCTLLLHMDESAWNNTSGEVLDASGAANHGTAVSSATTTSSPAKFGRAGSFGGIGYVSVPDSATLHAGNAFTISAWIYSTGLDGSLSPGILSKRIAYGSGTEFSTFVWTGNHIYVDIDGETDRFASNGVVSNNAWYHVAVVFDGSLVASQRARIYINGQLDSVHAETSSTVTTSSASVLVGNLPNGGDKFIGSIDDVAFWQRALTATEVSAIYQQNSPL